MILTLAGGMQDLEGRRKERRRHASRGSLALSDGRLPCRFRPIRVGEAHREAGQLGNPFALLRRRRSVSGAMARHRQVELLIECSRR